MADCESFHTAKTVSMVYDKVNDSWELIVSWLPHSSETECLNRILAKHGLEMVTTSERTVFRSKLKD